MLLASESLSFAYLRHPLLVVAPQCIRAGSPPIGITPVAFAHNSPTSTHRLA